MPWVSGRHEVCADPTCTAPTGSLTKVYEGYDVTDKVVVGEEHCTCGCVMLYSRKLVKGEPVPTSQWKTTRHIPMFQIPDLETQRVAADARWRAKHLTAEDGNHRIEWP
jgi:hypothetical protein